MEVKGLNEDGVNFMRSIGGGIYDSMFKEGEFYYSLHVFPQ